MRRLRLKIEINLRVRGYTIIKQKLSEVLLRAWICLKLQIIIEYPVPETIRSGSFGRLRSPANDVLQSCKVRVHFFDYF